MMETNFSTMSESPGGKRLIQNDEPASEMEHGARLLVEPLWGKKMNLGKVGTF